MSILSFQSNPPGLVGVVPQFLLINTDDSTAGVQVTGYLNGLASQGAALSQSNMALVAVSDSPHSKLFNISLSGDNWSLIPV